MKYAWVLVLGVILIMSSCYKEKYWLDDNADWTGAYYPVIQRVTADPSTAAVGDTVTVTVKYWSLDEVDRIELYHNASGDEELYSSTPFEDHFSVEENVQVLPLTYIVPAEAAGKKVTLRVAVVTKKDVEKSASTTVTVE